MANLSSKKWGFLPGQMAYLVLSFGNAMPVKNAQVFFVHEEDENQHLYFWFAAEENNAVQSSEATTLYFERSIPDDMKPGTYVLDKVNFETAGGNTIDAKMETEGASFEVLAEPEHPPVVKRLLVLPKHVYETVRSMDP